MASYIYNMIILILLSEGEFRRLSEGDPEILGRLYEEYQKSITTYFIVKTFGNRSIAEDLTHETFCSIMRSVHRLSARDKLSLWIFTIAKRTLIKHQRRLFRQRKYRQIMEERYEKPQELHEILDRKQKLLLFRIAVDALAPEYRKVFDMRYEGRESVKGIALKIGKTEKSVENMLRRIKQTLKEKMLAVGRNFFDEGEEAGYET